MYLSNNCCSLRDIFIPLIEKYKSSREERILHLILYFILGLQTVATLNFSFSENKVDF